MTSKQQWHLSDEYRKWEEKTVDVGGRSLVLASKPGVFSHGAVDPSSLLLAQHVRARAGDVVVHLNCGNGLLGAALAAAGDAARVALTDRSVLAIEASSRTLRANGSGACEVHFGHGNSALEKDLAADIVAIRIPREKLSMLQLLHDAFAILKPDGECFVAGATNEGVKPAARALEQLFGNVETVATKSSHRVVRAVKQSQIASKELGASDSANLGGLEESADNAASNPFLDANVFNDLTVALRGQTFTFSSRPGVFSWDHLDEATALLAEHMEVRRRDRVLDLGCGYGVLGVVAGRIAKTHPVTMVDVDSEAVRSATRSAHAAGLGSARVLGSDVAAAVLEEQFDLVVTNPPFHVGRTTDLSVPIQFIADAWAVLAPGGRLNLVANRTLPYERAIHRLFLTVTTLHDGPRFKVLSAVKGP